MLTLEHFGILAQLTTYANRGCHSNSSEVCGMFCLSLTTIKEPSFWSFGAHYAFRGGCSDLGAYCGAFSVASHAGSGHAYWYRGVAL